MKKINSIFTLCAITFSSFITFSSMAQNIFPETGSVGIGTTAPVRPLDIRLVQDIAPIGTIDGIRVYHNKAAHSTVYSDFGYDGVRGLAINSHAGGGTWANISLRTNGTTKMYIESRGKVGIGTVTPTTLLTVAGTITAEEIIVQDVAADYVFEDNYKLRSLKEVAQFIKENKHLPDVAPACETEKGIKVGEFNETLLRKIEELTLYMIELKKENEKMQEELSALQSSKSPSDK